MAIIETHQLTKYYGRVRGIENVNLSIDEGEIFGFIGPNGAGKSTAIRTLLNLIFPTSGSASIFGLDIVKDSKEIKKNIGYLPSESNYYDNMTVLELMQYSADFYGHKLEQYFYHLSERFELDLKRQLQDLSMGNKKKVSIVQSMLHQPRLIIMDEPTNGLDPLMQSRFFEVIREQNKKGVTIFFSSHILSDVQRLCKRVAVIRDGQIITIEEVEQLRKKLLKRCFVILDSAPDQQDFVIPGMENVKTVQENTLSFNFSGNINELTRHLSGYDIKDMVIEESDLEEIFMHYYEK